MASFPSRWHLLQSSGIALLPAGSSPAGHQRELEQLCGTCSWDTAVVFASGGELPVSEQLLFRHGGEWGLKCQVYFFILMCKVGGTIPLFSSRLLLKGLARSLESTPGLSGPKSTISSRGVQVRVDFYQGKYSLLAFGGERWWVLVWWWEVTTFAFKNKMSDLRGLSIGDRTSWPASKMLHSDHLLRKVRVNKLKLRKHQSCFLWDPPKIYLRTDLGTKRDLLWEFVVNIKWNWLRSNFDWDAELYSSCFEDKSSEGVNHRNVQVTLSAGCWHVKSALLPVVRGWCVKAATMNRAFGIVLLTTVSSVWGRRKKSAQVSL